MPFFVGNAGLPFAYGFRDITYTETEVMFFMTAFKPGKAVGDVVARIRESFRGRPYIALHVLMDHYKGFWKENYKPP
eukprot:1726708-Pyramimonas_sp.AAC.1